MKSSSSTFALFGALVVVVIALVVLSLFGKEDMTANTVLILGGGVTTLAGALAGFSQHKPDPLPPGSRTQEFSTVETPLTPKSPPQEAATT